MAAPPHEPGLKQAHFKGAGLPILLLLPQLRILLFFFFIPSVRALVGAFLLSDPFGATVHFVWFDNFTALLQSESYRNSLWVTVWFTVAPNVITIVVAGILAFATDRVVRGQPVYRGVILLPYAIAPVIAGVLWAFLFNPAVGPIAFFIKSLGFSWDPNLNGWDAMMLVVLAASWKHICYDYIFLLAGLLAIPCSLLEAAAVDGARPVRQFFQISLPLLPGGHFIENMITAWNKAHFGRLLFNSLVVALGITIGKVAISLLSAYAITYFRFRFRMLAFWLIFMSLMLPVEVRIVPTYESVANAALPIQWLIDLFQLNTLWEWISGNRVEIAVEWNMLNTYQGLILPLVASASATFLFRQFFLTVPEELLEAARLDGASAMRFFWTILLPLSRSNIAALSIILFLYGWNQYLWPLLFTTEKDMTTAVIGVKHLIPRSDTEPAWNVAMSGALLTMLPPVLVVLVMQRWFVKGLVDSSK